MVQAAATLTRPSYLDYLPLAGEAFEFTAERHAGHVREGGAAPFLPHPLEVGALLHVFRYPEHVVTAGLLHDVLESSDTTVAELRTRFGARIAWLVESVSEDPGVEDPIERKRRLRRRVAAAGPEAAAIFAADKLSKVRELRIRAVCDAAWIDQPSTRLKLEHYAASRAMLEDELGDLPLVQALAFELESLKALPPSRAVTSLRRVG